MSSQALPRLWTSYCIPINERYDGEREGVEVENEVVITQTNAGTYRRNPLYDSTRLIPLRALNEPTSLGPLTA